MDKLLMGIDIGTSACKVAIFNRRGEVLAQSNHSYQIYYPNPGWVEQDPNEWWNSVCLGIKECIAKAEIESMQINGVGIAGQGWSAIPVDENGNCLSNTPIWMDTRAKDIAGRVTNEIGPDKIFEVAGNAFLPAYTTPKLLWFKETMPEIYQQTYKFLQSNSFIGMKLTGVMSADKCQNYGVHFYNTKTCTYNEELADAMGLSIDKVPDIYQCHDIIGMVTKEAAAFTTLAEGTPVVAGGLDAACGTLGAGVYLPKQTQIQGGQAGGMSICEDQPIAHPQLIFSPHVVPDLWLLQGGTVGGGGVLRWFKQELGEGESFDELTALASEVPPGSDGVAFLPYMAGERAPIWNPDAKGVFYGLSFDKTKGHMVRAALEGVVFSVQHNLKVAEEAGVNISELDLRAMGGAANSELWVQIYADVTGCKIGVPTSDTATTLGAALLAGVGVGLYKDFKEAVEETVKVTRVQEPNMDNHEIYKKSMELYLELYESLKHIFNRSVNG
ncbi:xylulokinase [Bacillus canaveralius]|uniref:xylulokinase n=1 Tax=Bacillus canaveralius TaxID=1403243 RepID=UPI000F78E502|nr:FGGY-family carbohydrate kinase [Bacillus canaveralius]RSK53249.1 carbohydrate kinase [Bacillus canaveralius]